MKLIDLLVKELPKRGGWPEGAVECERFMDEATIDFYDKNGNWPVDCGEEYGAIAVECINPREAGDGFRKESVKKDEYESALAASQQPAWNGEGLPPVGTECLVTPHNNLWGFSLCGNYRGKVIAYKAERFWFEVDFGEDIISRTDKVDFKPIRTEAERKRDEFAKSLCDHLDDLTDWDSPVGKVHALAIYDAIAAGKIPHITLK